jgi:putative hydrolase of the HAD superfamily
MKTAIQYIFFDCMETLIDMNPVPSRDDYALWAYKNSGVEDLWPDYNEFLTQYNKTRNILNRKHTDLHEDSFSDRFAIMCQNNPRIPVQNKASEKITRQLTRNFLKTYYSRCFVHDDVKQMLPKLAKRYTLGIVSNFKSAGSIDFLLQAHGLSSYFEFVLVSISFGRRKPHKSIYREAIRKSKKLPEHILFIGDDLKNDLLLPLSLGMQALLLDRYNRYNKEYKTINTFYELESVI